MSLNLLEKSVKAKKNLCAGSFFVPAFCVQVAYGQGIDRYADDAVQRLSRLLANRHHQSAGQ